MYAEPPGLDRTLLAATLHQRWGIAAGRLTYEPVGFGAHHYRAGDRWWVNIDLTPAPADLDRLDTALRTAADLARTGLEFVHAPRPMPGGRYATAMPGGYAVSVFEFLEGESHEYGELTDAGLRLQVLHALGRLHTARPHVQPEMDTLDIPHRQTVLTGLGRPWTGGPYGEPARTLITRSAGHIQDRLDRYDELAHRIQASRSGWVVTHGEPHAGNVMRTRRGVKLIDWDTVRLAPPERDLWMIAPRGEGEWAAYGRRDVDPDTIDLYRRRWELSDICAYAATLRAPHADDADTRIAWRELQTYLGSPSSPAAAGPPRHA